MSFDFFIRDFVLIIDFEMSNDEKIILNVETFAKEFSNENDELKIAIENYWRKKIMNSKDVLNENFDNDFDERVFIFNNTKSIMTFFRKFINYDANRVVIVKIEKISDEIHEYVLSFFDEHRKGYEKIIVAIVWSFRTTTDVTVSNVLIHDNFHVELIVIAIDDLKSTQCTWMITHERIM